MSSERDIGAEFLAILDDPTIRPVMMVRLALDGALVIAWHTGYGEITYNGTTYAGTGVLIGISDLEEDTDLTPSSMTLTISGITPEIRAIVLGSTLMNRPAIVYLGALDDAGALVGDPMVWFDGTLRGGAKLVLGAEAAIQLEIVDSLADWERPLNLRLNNATQQSLHPGDRGLEYIESVAQQTIAWPGAHYWKHR